MVSTVEGRPNFPDTNRWKSYTDGLVDKFSLGIHIDTSHGPFGKLQALLTDIGLGINEEFELSFSENLLTCSDSTLREVLIKHYHRSICSKVITRTYHIK